MSLRRDGNNLKQLEIAVLVPCYNEEKTVAVVVSQFKKALPGSTVYVFDNNSKDNTVAKAKAAGAVVRNVRYQGKGNVVRRMFADVDADIYVMVDGDATYDAMSVDKMIDKLIDEDLDMVVGCRKEDSTNNKNYRPGHRLGNSMLTGFVSKIFDGQFTDMLSGYRVFSRRFVKSFSADSRGFETETELTIHALEMNLPYGEVATPYFERPEGSESKLSTYKDGLRIVKMILRLYSNERPLHFWTIMGSALLLVAAVVTVPILITYYDTGSVPRFPSLIAASALALTGVLFVVVGLILRTVTKGRKEMKHLAYLSEKSAQLSLASVQKSTKR